MNDDEKKKPSSVPHFDKFGNSLFNGFQFNGARNADAILQKVIRQKSEKKRPKPSDHFIDNSNLLTAFDRQNIIDKAAELVDENCYGRSEMCCQFAMLVKYQLKKNGIQCKIYEGDVKYANESKSHQWSHAWIITENNELIDCNIDSLEENPYAPNDLKPLNYWGPIDEMPADRTILSQKEFTEVDEEKLENQDDETKEWKSKIDLKN